MTNGGADVTQLAQQLILAALGDPPLGRAPAPAIGDLLERLCDAAHADGLRPEHVLLRLKAAWRDIPAVRRGVGDYEGLVLSRLITLCIDEYFAPWRGTRSSG